MISLFAIGLFLGVPEDSPANTDRVRDVLVAEAKDGSEIRDRAGILSSVRGSKASDDAWWQSGYVKADNKQWLDYDQAVRQTSLQDGLDEYESRRAKARTAKELLDLAKWCRQKKMTHHFRIHKLQALQLDPKVSSVRTAGSVGMVNVKGTWLTPAVAEDLEREIEFRKKSLRRYRRKCEVISTKLGGKPSSVEDGEKLLTALTDWDAVPAIDAYIGQRGRTGADHAVTAFGRVPTVRSTSMLAKYAVYANRSSTRSSAARELSERRTSHYVPALLKLLSSEIEKVEPYVGSSSLDLSNPFESLFTFKSRPTDLTFRNTYRRETHDSIATLDSTVSVDPFVLVLRDDREGLIPSYRPISDSDARAEANRQSQQMIATQYGRTIEQANRQIRELNERVIDVLATVSDQSSSNEDPEFWWDWWNSRTGTDAPQKNLIEIETRPSRTQLTRVEVGSSHSCFAAGTKVLTARGPRAIDTILAGDRVLSQDIRTGELEFRVVERPTVRSQAGPTVHVQLGGDSLICTPGHEIWVNGTGWVRAKDLEAGSRVRTLKGSVEVVSVLPSQPILTYNLVVEGHHNYFVGASRCLVHDVTTSIPTDNVAPGLSRFEVR